MGVNKNYGILNGEAIVEDHFITGDSINTMRPKINDRHITDNFLTFA